MGNIFNKKENSNEGSVAIVVIGVLAVVITIITYIYLVKGRDPIVEPVTPATPQTFGDLTQVVEISKLPGSLPQDLPVEKDVPLLRNETVYFSNRGELHSIRSYYSLKPINDILTPFKKYFEANKWKTVSTIDDVDNKFILVVKDLVNGTIQVNVSRGQIDGRVLVEIIRVDRTYSEAGSFVTPSN